MIFLSDNKVTDGVFSMITGTENAQFPLTNITHDFTTKVFRSNETTIEIMVDLQSNNTIDTFALVGSSVTGLGLGAVTIYGSGSTNFTGATAIPIDLSAEYNFGFKVFTGVAFRYWKLVITNTAGSYVELSNMYLGTKSELLTNGFATSTFSYTIIDNVEITKNKYSQRFIDTYNKTAMLSGSVQHADESEFTAISDVYVQNGRARPVWFILDKDNVLANDGAFLYSGYYYLENDFTTTMSAFNLYNIEIILSEAT